MSFSRFKFSFDRRCRRVLWKNRNAIEWLWNLLGHGILQCRCIIFEIFQMNYIEQLRAVLLMVKVALKRNLYLKKKSYSLHLHWNGWKCCLNSNRLWPSAIVFSSPHSKKRITGNNVLTISLFIWITIRNERRTECQESRAAGERLRFDHGIPQSETGRISMEPTERIETTARSSLRSKTWAGGVAGWITVPISIDIESIGDG